MINEDPGILRSIELLDDDCHDAEYEEVALILAEKGGIVKETELLHLRARCIR